ncbi:conserved hypothetical protein [Neospora caninum Liverpool]|uniref:Ribosome recycling factor domain-containing protein n=1 Tax=Neospora caninum (strain Liverpool) TaxID=572307 RepID=F0VH55_NEOCL|nr:conserved hypothetical protein [Neospora caninum Liverpool]CBZ53049.1 conserved hypothetical protein [Neospora caninum Liverpool]|eukprot:XP_003883081.1 conserved hypothetical protein [Neospora caninum Liverpool]
MKPVPVPPLSACPPSLALALLFLSHLLSSCSASPWLNGGAVVRSTVLAANKSVSPDWPLNRKRCSPTGRGAARNAPWSLAFASIRALPSSTPSWLGRNKLLSRRNSNRESGERGDKREKTKRRGRGEAEERQDPFANWTEDSFLDKTNESLQGATNRVKHRLAQLRPEAASVLALEKIFLRLPAAPPTRPSDGLAPVSVRSVVTVKQVSPSTLALQPLESSLQLFAAIEKALSTASLGLSVRTKNEDEKGAKRQREMLVDFPALTQERRLQLVNEARAEAEEGRVVLRRLRRELLEELRGVKKAGGIGEDRISKLQDRVQQATEKKIAEIDTTLSSKEKQLRTV